MFAPFLRNHLVRLNILPFTCAVLISGCSVLQAVTPGQTRTYFIAAEDVDWNYAPSFPINKMNGQAFSDKQKTFVACNHNDRIGSTYKKARFVEYTDQTFSRKKVRKAEWKHLGILGPLIRAAVGDTIYIVFRNNTANKEVSLHPHGLFYTKSSEGSAYDDTTKDNDKSDEAIPPGGSHEFRWQVPERAGPGPEDPDSIAWLYHSHAHEPEDTNAGLIGPIIVSRPGTLLKNGKQQGVDREFINLFTIFDENSSPYQNENIITYARNADPDDADFQESNLMHSINGYVYGNLPGLEMKVGEKARWYQLALGTEVDLHTPHWHGNTLLLAERRVDVINFMPASQITLDMTPDNPGVWMYHCHVNDHIIAGMMTTYWVKP